MKEELQPLLAASAANDLLPSNLRPSLKKTRSDKPVVYENGCLADFGHASNPECEYGNPGGSTTIVLFGDSHAAQWFPALEAAALRNDWRLIVLAKMGCPAITVSVTMMDGGDYGGCDLWRYRSIDRIVDEIGRAHV